MVVLTIVTQKNGETIYFEDPIPKVHIMKLICCSLFNSWDTLEKEGSARLGDIQSSHGVSVSKLPPGHYDLESLAKEIDGLFAKYSYRLKTETNTPVGQLAMKNSGLKPIELDNDLANLLGIRSQVKCRNIANLKRLYAQTSHKNKQILTSLILRKLKTRFDKNLEKNLWSPAQI